MSSTDTAAFFEGGSCREGCVCGDNVRGRGNDVLEVGGGEDHVLGGIGGEDQVAPRHLDAMIARLVLR
jgi:hypothetical protein